MEDNTCCVTCCCSSLVYLVKALDACCCHQSCIVDITDDKVKKCCNDCHDAIVNAIQVCLTCCDNCCKDNKASGLIKGNRIDKYDKN